MTAMIVLIGACLLVVACLGIMILARIRRLNEKLPKRARIMKGCATAFALMTHGFTQETAIEHAARDIGINTQEELEELIAAYTVFQENAVKYKKSLEYKRESA